jgi:hypothetical protein
MLSIPLVFGSGVIGGKDQNIKDYEIGICCFSAKQAALRSKSKDCLFQSG